MSEAIQFQTNPTKAEPSQGVRGKIAVITGASTGIGRATALLFAAQGATVVLAARDDAILRDLEQHINQQGYRALAVPTDVADYAQVQRLAERAVEQFGRIDVWVNNAVQTLYGTVEHTEVEEFRHLMEVNYMGQVHGTKAVLPIMRRQGQGAIIFVSSLEARIPIPLQAAYGATKAAITSLASVTRQELLGSGISVSTVFPASIDTPFFEHARSKEGFKPRTMPPFYSPTAVARVIVDCAIHPRREAIAGGVGRIALGFQAIAPGLVEAITARFGAQAQLTDIPEPPSGQDNFDRPMAVADPLTGGLHGRETAVNARLLQRGQWGIAIVGLLALSALTLRIARAR